MEWTASDVIAAIALIVGPATGLLVAAYRARHAEQTARRQLQQAADERVALAVGLAEQVIHAARMLINNAGDYDMVRKNAATAVAEISRARTLHTSRPVVEALGDLIRKVSELGTVASIDNPTSGDGRRIISERIEAATQSVERVQTVVVQR